MEDLGTAQPMAGDNGTGKETNHLIDDMGDLFLSFSFTKHITWHSNQSLQEIWGCSSNKKAGQEIQMIGS